MTDTLERLRAILQREFDLPAEKLVPDATLESLEVDSLRMIEVLFAVEEEFGITMPSDHNELRQRLRTLQDLAAVIAEAPKVAAR